MVKKNNLSLKMPEDEEEARDMVRARAKATTSNIWIYQSWVD